MDVSQQKPVATVAVPRLNHLCNTCSSYFPSDKPWPWLVERIDVGDGVLLWKFSIMQLVDSAATECHLCTLLLKALLPERTLIGIKEQPQDQYWMRKTMYQIQMLPDSLDVLVGGFVLRIKIDTENPENAKDLHFKPVRPSVDDNSNQRSWTLLEPIFGTHIDVVQTRSSTNINPPAIQQIKNWLRTCTEEHDTCRGSDSATSFPQDSTFRLVDIGVHTDDPVRLVDVDNSLGTSQMKYITLSYRWTDKIKRTSLNAGVKDQFYRSIQTDAWPQIYRDAVLVARQLGIRYLWIDSLCIVQGQKEDWKGQAALMDKIYGCGFLNLAGVEGERSLGLEVTRNPLRVAPCLFTLTRPGREPPLSTIQNWLCYRPDDIRKAVDRAPLYDRGWTFQERVLSKRTVHFGDQLFWECTCLRASETFPLGVDFTNHPESLDDAIKRIRETLQQPSTSMSSDSNDWNNRKVPDIFPLSPTSPAAAGLHRLWCTVVRYYSSARLTEASDRLEALKGITNSLARRYGLSETDYTAGLWKPLLPLQLLWAREKGVSCFREDREDECRLPKHFPSWSWASCPGEAHFVQLDTGFVRSFIRLDDVQAFDNTGRTN
ncbi:heterokaryon incompatibility protein-domain-containing protein [Coniochaeta sp. 2T2.1]|nr:heterokaryon incompatibility protein-domain-containing protein [Coniochaeta sp. 2T2.1]